MTVQFTPVIGTLGYLWDQSSDRVLMVHRTARPNDEHLGKWNGLGGKLEPGEDIVSSLRREFREEANIELVDPTLVATISWPGFGPQDWFGFVFLITQFTGTIPTSNEEGTLHWVEREQIIQACSPESEAAKSLPMWEGDRHFLPLVFDGAGGVIHGVMPYENGLPLSWDYVRI